MKSYTRDDLLSIVESHPDPAVRRIAGEMLHTMGQRDQADKSVKGFTPLTGLNVVRLPVGVVS